MRCPRCEFENMPGLDRCFKCGSLLQVEANAIDIQPPRMAGWKRPVRYFARWARKFKIIPTREIHIPLPRWMPRMARDEFLGVVLSIVPGLAHILQKRFHEIRWYCLAWLILLFGALFLYGSDIGLFLLALTIGLHGYIAFNASLRSAISEFFKRIITLAIMCLYILVIYWCIGHVVFYDLTGANTALDIPHYNISSGDYLLGRRSLVQTEMPRGTMVQIPLSRVNNRYIASSRNSMMGQIIGLPGEALQIKEGIFWIDESPLDSQIFPVPKWLRNRELSIRIPSQSYFVSNEYTIQIHGNVENMLNRMIQTVCVIPTKDIEARAILLWMPLHKRSFLESIE